jgi:hypothetical protein
VWSRLEVSKKKENKKPIMKKLLLVLGFLLPFIWAQTQSELLESCAFIGIPGSPVPVARHEPPFVVNFAFYCI